MMKSTFIPRVARPSALLAAIVAVNAVAAPPPAAAAGKPNILFILVDDLGWMDLRCQGNSHLETPNIDRLARQGMRFTDAYAAAPVCSPTRGAIMTGQSPARLHITNHLPEQARFTPKNAKLLPALVSDHLPLEQVTIAERLRDDAGYATAFIGKWHLYVGTARQFAPSAQGFNLNLGGCSLGGPPTYFDPYKIDFLPDRKPGEYLTERLADETISFIREQHRQQRPFFTALFTYTVHWPMEPPAELATKYKDRLLVGYHDSRYAAMIEEMDHAVGRVLGALDELGIADETFVVFTSDNGAFGGVGDCRPLRGDKGHLYEGGIRVPLVVRWPGKVKPATISAEPVILTDFFPTLLEVASLSPTPGVPADGESLVPLLRGSGRPHRDALFWHYPNFAFHGANRLGSAIRMGDHKVIQFFEDDSVELYDLKRDISESTNLADAKPELTATMRQRLATWLKDSGANLPRPR
jgi:arylsulfatase A